MITYSAGKLCPSFMLFFRPTSTTNSRSKAIDMYISVARLRRVGRGVKIKTRAVGGTRRKKHKRHTNPGIDLRPDSYISSLVFYIYICPPSLSFFLSCVSFFSLFVVFLSDSTKRFVRHSVPFHLLCVKDSTVKERTSQPACLPSKVRKNRSGKKAHECVYRPSVSV